MLAVSKLPESTMSSSSRGATAGDHTTLPPAGRRNLHPTSAPMIRSAMATWRRPPQAPPKVGGSDPDPEWTRGSLLAVWLFLPLLCGCLVVPSEIELTVELGADQVEVQASLRDIQLWTEDPVEALRIFHNVH